MVLAAAGAVDHATLLAEAERHLAALDASGTPEPSSAAYAGGMKRGGRTFEQSHIVLAFEAPAYRDDDYFTAQICAGALGGGMSSRLFQEVRERRGLCYAIYAFANGLDDTGMFAIHAACASDRAHDLFAVIRDELVKAAGEGFRADEVARVKAQLKMGLLTGLESSGARSEQIARQILIYGRLLSTEELTERVDRVEAKDLQALLEGMLASPVSLATVGPIVHVARFDSLAAKFTLAPSQAA